MSETITEYPELGLRTVVEGDAWEPTPHGRSLAIVLKNGDFLRGLDVLELGAGTAIHTVLIERQGAKSVTATEITQEFADVTRRNMELNDAGERTSYFVADWLNLEAQFDAIVTNPPFARSGKRNRRYFIDDLILNGHKCLRPGGKLIYIQSSMADVPKSLTRLAENGFDAEVIENFAYPFRAYYYEDPTFLEEARLVEGGFEVRDGKEWETLSVIEARLRDWTPPEFAHAVQT